MKRPSRQKISKSLTDSIAASGLQNKSKSNTNHFNTTSNTKQPTLSSIQITNISKNIQKNIFKPVYTGFTKNAFGSIPPLTENFLIHTKEESPRFNDVKSIYHFDNYPGVGKYNIESNNWEKPGWSFSKNGLNQRFNTPITNYYPGIGDYNVDEDKQLERKRNNIRYKSLFKYPVNKLKKSFLGNSENLGPSSTSYNIIYQDDIIKYKKHYNFDSFTGRDQYTGYDLPFNSKNNYPGPGYYFQTAIDPNNEKNKKKININENNNYEDEDEDEDIKKTEKLAKKYCDTPEITPIKLKSRSPKTNKVKVFSIDEVQKQNLFLRQKEKDDKISALEKLLKKKPDYNERSSNLHFKIEQEKELNYIKSVLGNNNGKRDLFYLCCPRWKENKYKFKIPGPAYYFNDDLS